MLRFILPLMFIIASVGIFLFFTNPKYQETKINRVQLERLADALKKANQLRDIRDRLMEERNAISPMDQVRIAKMLPDSVENIGLIIELNNIARDKGLELLSPSIDGGASSASAGNSSATPAGPTPGTSLDIGPDSKKFGSLRMNFSVNTTYEQFIDFLKELERTLRLVDVTSVKFSSPDPKTGKTNFSITIQTYWLKK